jgi:hypothetical protein
MVLSAANRTLTPAALEAATVAESHSTAGDGPFGFSTDHFPLGFDADDPQLRAAATLLRVLFVNDLRNLQTQVDRLIVEMQVPFTPCPPSRRPFIHPRNPPPLPRVHSSQPANAARSVPVRASCWVQATG